MPGLSRPTASLGSGLVRARSCLWQRAIREQARISGFGDPQANKTLVVNHLTHLQQQVPWFTAEARLREAAIDETLRHAVRGEHVPSQQAWARYWARRTPPPGRDAAALSVTAASRCSSAATGLRQLTPLSSLRANPLAQVRLARPVRQNRPSGPMSGLPPDGVTASARRRRCGCCAGPAGTGT
jgi:hypothetical protein